MSVDQWKEIEKDIVEILLSEVYPGEDISEAQLNFTALMRSFKFMSQFIEMLEANRLKADCDENNAAQTDVGVEVAPEEVDEPKATSGKTFEV